MIITVETEDIAKMVTVLFIGIGVPMTKEMMEEMKNGINEDLLQGSIEKSVIEYDKAYNK